jgi:hypothetical protein
MYKSTSYKIRRRWAVHSSEQLRYRYPELDTQLYESAGQFYLWVKTPVKNFSDLSKEFDYSIRPVTCPISLVAEALNPAFELNEFKSYGDELWLSNWPSNASDLNNLLFLACPTLPKGNLDFSFDDDSWVFNSVEEVVNETQITSLKIAAKKIGLEGDFKFNVIESLPNKVSLKDIETLTLIPSRHNAYSPNVKKLVEKDEDSWREFIRSRESQTIPVKGVNNTTKFSCLFDTEDNSDIHLSELLTIYDCVDIIPKKMDQSWLSKHNLTVSAIQELVSIGRLRVILPYSAHQYPSSLIESVADVDPSSLILSRSLASKTINKGQFKEPMLYGPFSSGQRIDLLRILYDEAKDPRFKQILDCYCDLFRGQQYAYMNQGATANLSHGVGNYLGNLIYSIQNKNAILELSVAGACMEWAMGLGSSFIPRQFGEGYDETSNCHLIASYLGRVKAKTVDPVTERMHMLSDGLLAVTDTPPLEVARNFSGAPITRFRNLAIKLMHGASTVDEMKIAIDDINREVKSFEGKVKTLKAWKLDSLSAGAVGKLAGDIIDTSCGNYSSVIAAWIYSLIKEKASTFPLSRELSDALNMLVGLSLGSTVDAIVVSRSKKTIHDPL